MNTSYDFKFNEYLKLFIFSALMIIGSGILLELISIKDSAGLKVSFFRFYGGGDYGFYEFWQSRGLKLLTEPMFFFIQGSDGLVQWIGQPFRAGPIFVWFLDVTQYSPNNIIYYKIVNLCLGAALISIWLYFLRDWGINIKFQIFYLFCPLTLWIILIPGPDLILSLCVFLIYYFMDQKVYSRKRLLILAIVLILSILTKPNALVFVLFYLFFAYLYASNVRDFPFCLAVSFSVILITIYMTAYYLPYFLMYSNSSKDLSYWNIPERVFLENIWNWQTDFLNSVFWFFKLIASKLLYLTGFRPSFGEQPMYTVAIRGASSLILIPGIFGLLVSKNLYDKIFCTIVVSPCFFGAAQERYLVPVLPIVFYYGAITWQSLYLKLTEAIQEKDIEK